MAKLTKDQRNSLPDSAFAGPHRSNPIPDKAHAADAKARAAQAVEAGRITKAAEKRIDANADKVIRSSKKR